MLGPSTSQPAARSASSDEPDVLGLFALAAGREGELDALTLFEGLVTRTLDVRVVNDHIVAAVAGDEAEALLSVEELHSACSQQILFSLLTIPPERRNRKRPPYRFRPRTTLVLTRMLRFPGRRGAIPATPRRGRAAGGRPATP